jgi:prepilin signal peptidase PulO-like enzyme (type II secretory pathway)
MFMNPLVVAVLWGLVGVGAGLLVRRGNVWLARREGLAPGGERWQVYGPVVLATVLFAVFGWRIGWQWPLLVRSLWVAVLVQVIFFDAEHHLILDRVLLPAGLAGLVLSLVTPGLGWQSALIAGAAAGGLFLLIAVAGALVFRAEAMGLGDVKLAAFIGLILGLLYTGPALLAGVILAGVVVFPLVIFKIRGMRDSIAYGPFLAAGALFGLFLASGSAQ